jgi:hypothetical protein
MNFIKKKESIKAVLLEVNGVKKKMEDVSQLLIIINQRGFNIKTASTASYAIADVYNKAWKAVQAADAVSMIWNTNENVQQAKKQINRVYNEIADLAEDISKLTSETPKNTIVKNYTRSMTIEKEAGIAITMLTDLLESMPPAAGGKRKRTCRKRTHRKRKQRTHRR